MKKMLLLIAFWWLVSTPVFCQFTNNWGDQGNGTYINPILNADYFATIVIGYNIRNAIARINYI